MKLFDLILLKIKDLSLSYTSTKLTVNIIIKDLRLTKINKTSYEIELLLFIESFNFDRI